MLFEFSVLSIGFSLNIYQLYKQFLGIKQLWKRYVTYTNEEINLHNSLSGIAFLAFEELPISIFHVPEKAAKQDLPHLLIDCCMWRMGPKSA